MGNCNHTLRTTWLLALLAASISTLCSPEPDLCSRCDSTAECESKDPLVVLPAQIPTTITELHLFYSGPNTTLKANVFSRYFKLRSIVIIGKNIESIEAKTFTHLTRLEQLVIRETNIRALPEKFLPSSLRVLRIEYGKLTSIPHHIFSSVPLLTNLSLNFNYISHHNCKSIGNEFKNIQHLESLKLANFTLDKNCEEQVNSTFFEPVQHTVKTLNLTLSNVYGGEQTVFKNFLLLEDLDISLARQFLQCPANASLLFSNLPRTLRILTLTRWRSDTTANTECAITNHTVAGLKDLKQLHTIDLKYSDLVFGSVLKKALFDGFHQLSRLDLGWCRFSSIEDHIFDRCQNLNHLSLNGNPLGNRPFKLFSSRQLSKLQTLTMAGASIYTDYIRDYHPGDFLDTAPLKLLDFSQNQLHWIPIFGTNETIFDSLETIKLNGNYLKSLYLISERTFKERCEHLPKLNTLELNDNTLETLEGLCYSLTHLYLANNKIIKDWGKNQAVISGLENLIILDLSGNEIVSIKNTLFDKMPNLTELYMSNNNISETILDYVHNNFLLEILDLRYNYIREIDLKSIEHLKHLRRLQLDSNSISSLDEALLEFLDSLAHLEEFGLRGNALQCRCTQDFVQNWIKKTKYVPAAALIDCHGPGDLKGVKIHEYIRDDYSCDQEIYVIVSLSTLGGIVFIVLLVIPIYRYRWYILHIKIVFLAIKRQASTIRLEHVCIYDAYVIYNPNCDEDLDFVVNKLLPAVEIGSENENKEGLKLYIHDREALPGTHKHTEMLKGMEQSRKVILVLSNSFLANSECRGQADLAGRESYGQKCYQPNKILVIVREKLNEDAIKPPFTSLLTENVIDIQDNDEKVVQRAMHRVRKFISKPRYEYRKDNKDKPIAMNCIQDSQQDEEISSSV